MKLAVVAGEASGDLHAAEVIRELKKLDPTLQTFGIGGDLLAREGMTILHHAREMGIVGLFNVIRHLGMFRRVFRELVERIREERPDVVLLVDYPDFNLRMARRCKKLGLRVVYYISPQIWAWRRGRVRQIAKYVDHMIVIFPFEEDFYRQHNVPVTYVGHPLVEEMQWSDARPRASAAEVGRRSTDLRLALLPGSRRMEVSALLPPMLEAVKILSGEKKVEALIIQAPTIERGEIDAIADRSSDPSAPGQPRTEDRGPRTIRIVPHDRGESLADADVALSSSGTATLECAIVGTPVVVMYRLSPMTYRLARLLVKLPHFSLVNIIAGKKIVPELLQHDVTGPKIAAAVREVLANYDRVRGDLAVVKGKLGESGASRRAAEAIMSVVRG